MQCWGRRLRGGFSTRNHARVDRGRGHGVCCADSVHHIGSAEKGTVKANRDNGFLVVAATNGALQQPNGVSRGATWTSAHHTKGVWLLELINVTNLANLVPLHIST